VYNKILVGVDASENSTRALQVAAELSKEFGAELHVFHAIAHHYEPLTVPGQPGPTAIYRGNIDEYYKQVGRDVIEHARQVIESLDFASELTVDYHLELEISPEEFAVGFANDYNMDLIVIGCRGHHGRIRAALLGTVATKIINEATVQVLIVR
jgi:nucleotide-binding universal stress UspA family protein